MGTYILKRLLALDIEILIFHPRSEIILRSWQAIIHFLVE